jgi:protein-tyrosine phosphatase
VYRSDSLHHLTVEDGPRLAEIGITSAIDFRADDELDRIGIGRLGELDIRHLHLPTVDRALHTVRPPDWEPPESAAEVYEIMLRTGGAAYAAALGALTEPDVLPAVYFCMAGKDRTGVFSAVVLGLLGVSDDDIVADYALTVEGVARFREWAAREWPEWAERAASIPPAYTAALPDSMSHILDELRAEHATIRNYVRSIGVSDTTLNTLESVLLA